MFALRWMDEAAETYERLRAVAEQATANRAVSGKTKSGRGEGLFKQIHKTVRLLGENPRHPGLHTHEYDDIEHPFDKAQKVFEAYAQNNTPGAYRVFWCYGPEKGEITILEITAHP